MALQLSARKVKKVNLGTKKIKKVFLGERKVYSSGSVVTYYVDTGIVEREEMEEGQAANRPKTVTPAKAGWTFYGWRADSQAVGTVYGQDGVADLPVGDQPITLYAVFRQAVSVTFYNGNATPQANSRYRYYNNGSVANPCFALSQAALPGWTVRGWSTGTAGNSGITYANGAAFTRDSNITLYGMYQQTITVTYYNGSASPASTAGTRYYNSGSGSVVNPSFALSQAALSGWAARGWSTGTAGNSGITYANGAAFTRDSNITLYGMYYQTITLSYDGNGATGGGTAAQTGYRYYNSNGAVVNPSFVLSGSGFGRPGYSFQNWAMGSAYGAQYAVGASVALAANTTMYAVWTYVGAPFYIVQNSTVLQTLEWSFPYTKNAKNPKVNRWNVGGSRPEFGSSKNNDSEVGEFDALSGIIATNGNHTLSIRGEASTSGGNTGDVTVTVNGVQKTMKSGGGVTFDISNATSINIKIRTYAYGWTGDIWMVFNEIYLY